MAKADGVYITPPTNTSALHPLDVVIDLLGGADFDHEILDPEAAAKLILERLADAGFRVVPAPRGRIDPPFLIMNGPPMQPTTNTTNPDAAIFEAIERWRALWRAEGELPDRDPRGAELRRKAYDLEWEIASLAPSSVEGYRAKRAAIEAFEFDDEDLLEIIFQLGVDAGKIGIDCEMPDRAAR